MAIIKAITPRQSSLGEKGIAFVVSIASHSLQFSREIWRQAGSQSKLYSKWISVWEFYEYFQKKKKKILCIKIFLVLVSINFSKSD